MSLNSLVPEGADLAVFTLASIALVVASALVIKHRSLVYAAFFLSIAGMANAVLFALLGYTFIALFHIAVYVGAAVTFILFSITMFKDVGPVEPRARGLAALSTILICLALIGLFYSGWNIPLEVKPIPYMEMASYFLTSYWFTIIVATIALVTTLIEAITLARREVEG